MGIISYLFDLVQDMALAAIPAVGFAMVFNVPQRALRWCALLGAIGHGSRMVMMSAGFNIEWATFLAALRRQYRHSVVALVSGASEDIYRRRGDPNVPWDFGLYGDDLSRQNQPFWLLRRDDDYAVEQLFKSLLHRRGALYRAVYSRSVALSQTPARVTASAASWPRTMLLCQQFPHSLLFRVEIALCLHEF